MRVLVTGGTGFLGKRVVKRLLAEGNDVRCVVRPSSDVAAIEKEAAEAGRGSLELVVANLGNADECVQACTGCDAVYHIAAEMQGGAAILFMANVIGTRTLTQAALQCGVSRFVLISSLAVHGTAALRNGTVVDETIPLDESAHLRDPYTYSKTAQEQLCWELHKTAGLPLVVVRPGVIYGSGRDCLAGRIGLKFGSLMLVMNSNYPLPFVHVENCAAAIVQAGSLPDAVGQSFNIIDDNMPTARKLMRMYRKQVGGVYSLGIPGFGVSLASRLNLWYHSWSRGQLPAILTPYKSRSQWGPFRYSNEKAKKVLGWQPTRKADEALAETLQWLREQRLKAKRQPIA